jgi:chemotaxis protein CheD
MITRIVDNHELLSDRERNKKFINVGEFYIGINPTEVCTILGSCVAVCLYDRMKNIGGMNHYLIPLWKGKGVQSTKYGNVAIHRLVEGMMNNGCRVENLEAKIFGGGNVINSVSNDSIMVGKKNILIAHEVLDEYRIPVMAKDVGGVHGRHIVLQSETGKVLLNYINEER